MDLHFAHGRADLDPAGKQALEQVAGSLKALQDPYQVTISGHASRTGSRPHNLALSLRRARNAAQALERLGIPADRIQVEGFGFDRPVATNRTLEGQAKNRRVEVRIVADSLEPRRMGTPLVRHRRRPPKTPKE